MAVKDIVKTQSPEHLILDIGFFEKIQMRNLGGVVLFDMTTRSYVGGSFGSDPSEQRASIITANDVFHIDIAEWSEETMQIAEEIDPAVAAQTAVEFQRLDWVEKQHTSERSTINKEIATLRNSTPNETAIATQAMLETIQGLSDEQKEQHDRERQHAVDTGQPLPDSDIARLIKGRAAEAIRAHREAPDATIAPQIEAKEAELLEIDEKYAPTLSELEELRDGDYAVSEQLFPVLLWIAQRGMLELGASYEGFFEQLVTLQRNTNLSQALTIPKSFNRAVIPMSYVDLEKFAAKARNAGEKGFWGSHA